MIDVYTETGQKLTFASAVDWPGWSRSGRDEASALKTLFDHGPRYALVLRAAGIAFDPPDATSAFNVVERLPGGSTTDFGAPGIPASSDNWPVDQAELARLQAILAACWQAFDRAV